MITDYHFEKYYLPFMQHLKRHFASGKTLGSIFTGNRFRTPRDVVDYAFEQIKNRYHGERLILQKNLDEIIGLEGIVKIKDLLPTTSFKRDTREKKKDSAKRAKNYTVWVAYGIKRQPTHNLVIIAEPLPSNPNIHTFSSIYPGKYAPDFDDAKFWNEHAFINEKKL